MHNEAVSEVDETNSVSTSPLEETHDESIWGVDETNSMATRRIGAIHADTIWKVDATSSEDDETARNNGSTSRKTNLVSDLTSYILSCAADIPLGRKLRQASLELVSYTYDTFLFERRKLQNIVCCCVRDAIALFKRLLRFWATF